MDIYDFYHRNCWTTVEPFIITVGLLSWITLIVIVDLNDNTMLSIFYVFPSALDEHLMDWYFDMQKKLSQNPNLIKIQYHLWWTWKDDGFYNRFQAIISSNKFTLCIEMIDEFRLALSTLLVNISLVPDQVMAAHIITSRYPGILGGYSMLQLCSFCTVCI